MSFINQDSLNYSIIKLLTLCWRLLDSGDKNTKKIKSLLDWERQTHSVSTYSNVAWRWWGRGRGYNIWNSLIAYHVSGTVFSGYSYISISYFQKVSGLHGERIPSYNWDSDLKRIKYIKNTKQDTTSKKRDNVLCCYFWFGLLDCLLFWWLKTDFPGREEEVFALQLSLKLLLLLTFLMQFRKFINIRKASALESLKTQRWLHGIGESALSGTSWNTRILLIPQPTWQQWLWYGITQSARIRL